MEEQAEDDEDESKEQKSVDEGEEHAPSPMEESETDTEVGSEASFCLSTMSCEDQGLRAGTVRSSLVWERQNPSPMLFVTTLIFSMPSHRSL